jgi:hypothetical protein
MAVTMKNAVFWDVTPCGSCTSSQRASVACYCFFPSSPILVTLMIEALRSFETSVRKIATWRYIRKDDILHSQCRENLKSYIALTGWTL